MSFMCMRYSISFSIFRLADAALSAAAEAKKGTTNEATNAFQHVQDEIIEFGAPRPREDAIGGHRKCLVDPRTALEKAAQKDKKKTNIISKITSVATGKAAPVSYPSYPRLPNCSQCESQVSKGPVRKVNFVILKSPHERLKDQSIVRRQYASLFTPFHSFMEWGRGDRRVYHHRRDRMEIQPLRQEYRWENRLQTESPFLSRATRQGHKIWS